jgi:hypothetical protein
MPEKRRILFFDFLDAEQTQEKDMRYILPLILICMFSPVFAADKDKEKKQSERVVDIYYQKRLPDKEDKNKEPHFFMWIKDVEGYTFHVENTAPNVSVGWSVDGDTGMYLTGKVTNMMWFVHPYEKGKPNHETDLVVVFGGSRDDDINIYLPKNTKSRIQISSPPYKAKE